MLNSKSISNRTGGVSSIGIVLLLSACGGSGGDSESLDSPKFAAVVSSSVYDLYVATSGSDTNPGTKSAPFKTILKASQSAIAGSTIHVAAGVYPGGFKTTANGTAASRIRFLSDTKWGAKIVPPASSTSDSGWDNRGNYIDIEGFDVDGSVTQKGTAWLNGIYTGGSYNVIKNNHVHHIAKGVSCSGGGGGGIGADSYYGGVNADVLANVVNDIGPAGCATMLGVYLNTSGSIKNNLVYAISNAGINLWHDANHVNVINNTVFGSNNGIIVGGGGYYRTTGPNDYTNVSNNIVFDNKYGISEQGATGTHNTYSNNLVVQNSTANWTLLNGLTPVASVAADPQFVNYVRTGGGDYHLKSTSPAIDKGSATYAPATDLGGAIRPQGSAVDIGAYESAIAAPAPTPTPTPTPTPITTTTPATTYNYYVATTGSDSNPGTQAAPFKTILKASQVTAANSTIHVASGTYPGGFQTTKSGTSSGRIYYVSDTKWGAKIVPSSSTSADTLWDNRGNYVDIIGFDVDGTNGSANWLNGIYAGGSYTVIRNNHVHHIAKNVTPSGAGGSGIGTDNYYGGVSDDVIANVVHDIGPTSGTGIQGIYISTNGNVYNNLVYNIQDTCLHTWHNANRVNFINNTVFNCYNGAGVIIGGGGYYNGYSAGNDYSNVSNNIVFDSAYGIVENGTTGTHNTYTNNLVFGSKNYNWSLHNGLTSSGTVTADPQFVNYLRTGGGDYHLKSTSPAINKGLATYAPSVDLDGIARPQGTAVDIGAYEYH